MNKLYTLIILAWGVGVSPRLFASDSIRENVQTRSEFNLSQDKRRHARKSYLVDMLSIGGACLTFLVTYVGYRLHQPTQEGLGSGEDHEDIMSESDAV